MRIRFSNAAFAENYLLLSRLKKFSARANKLKNLYSTTVKYFLVMNSG